MEAAIVKPKTIRTARTDCLIVQEVGVSLPETAAQVITFDSKLSGISNTQRAMTAISLLVRNQSTIDMDMLRLGIMHRFSDDQRENMLGLVERVASPSG